MSAPNLSALSGNMEALQETDHAQFFTRAVARLWQAFAPAPLAILEPGEQLRRGGDEHHVTAEEFSRMYNLAYAACTAKPPHNLSPALYSYVIRSTSIAVTSALEYAWCHYLQWQNRDALVATYEHFIQLYGLVTLTAAIFKYLDRFYVRSMNLSPLGPAVQEAVQSALARWQPSAYARACRARSLARATKATALWMEATYEPGGTGFARAAREFEASRESMEE